MAIQAIKRLDHRIAYSKLSRHTGIIWLNLPGNHVSAVDQFKCIKSALFFVCSPQ